MKLDFMPFDHFPYVRHLKALEIEEIDENYRIR